MAVIFIDFSGVIITYANLPPLKPLTDISRRSNYFIGINIFIEFSVGFAGIYTLRVIVLPSKKTPKQQQKKTKPKLNPEIFYYFFHYFLLGEGMNYFFHLLCRVRRELNNYWITGKPLDALCIFSISDASLHLLYYVELVLWEDQDNNVAFA